jgi:hypothetical protein
MNPTQPEQANSMWALLRLPSHWPMQTDLLQWCHDMSPAAATVLIIGGIIFLLFGWQIFKALVTLNAALLGAYIGSRFGQVVGSSLAGALVGAFFIAALTWPVMKYAVAVMGGIFGALLGASAWRAAGLEPGLCWAGALIGLITFGLLSFIIFKGSVMMYTSLQGSVMLIFGILGLIYKYQDLAPRVTENMTVQPFLLPLAIFIPAFLGLIYQQTQFGQPEPAKKKS